MLLQLQVCIPTGWTERLQQHLEQCGLCVARCSVPSDCDHTEVSLQETERQGHRLCGCELYLAKLCLCVEVTHSFIQTHGVPQYFGIYYAMGIALIIEGFMSSFYHICPTNANFQFGESVSIACHANAITQPTVLCPHRYGIHVHHWRPVPGEGVPEQTPRHPFQRFPCILLLCCSYILHTVWPGKSILRLYGIIMCACQYVLLYSRSISHCLPSSSVL